MPSEPKQALSDRRDANPCTESDLTTFRQAQFEVEDAMDHGGAKLAKFEQGEKKRK